LTDPRADRFHAAVTTVRTDVREWIAKGQEAMRARRYAEACALFDRALAEAPDDPEVQSLAVTSQFWRRLAREGDGIPSVPRAPR
jgi:hypothetical protein